jgi:hypothetical protein
VLLQPAPKEYHAEKVRQSEKTMEVLRKNEMIDGRFGDPKKELTTETNHLDISKDALIKILTHYKVAPGACTHIRGQEQIFGTRKLHGEDGALESFGKFMDTDNLPIPVHLEG